MESSGSKPPEKKPIRGSQSDLYYKTDQTKPETTTRPKTKTEIIPDIPKQPENDISTQEIQNPPTEKTHANPPKITVTRRQALAAILAGAFSGITFGAYRYGSRETTPHPDVIKKILSNKELLEASKAKNISYDHIVEDLERFGYEGEIFYKKDGPKFKPSVEPELVFLNPVTTYPKPGDSIFDENQLSANFGIYMHPLDDLDKDIFAPIDIASAEDESNLITAIRVKNKNSYENLASHEKRDDLYLLVMGVETDKGIEYRWRDFPKNEVLQVSKNTPPFGITSNSANAEKPYFET